MLIDAILVKTDRTKEPVQVDNDSLAKLQALVGGWVELFRSDDGNVTFWFNEEGKVHDLPINPLATAYWWALCPDMANHDVLNGDVVITGGSDNHEKTLPIPDQMARFVNETYLADEDDD